MEFLEDRTVPSILVDTASDLVAHSGTSLRDAIALANAEAAAGTSDTINFASNLAGATITLTQGQLELSGAGGGMIAIDGHNLSSPITISGNNTSRIFQVDSSVSALFRGLVLTAGNAGSSVMDGGGIYNSGSLTLAGNTIHNCHAFRNGGGVDNAGTLTMNGNTLASNSQSGFTPGEIGYLWGGSAIFNSATLIMSGNSVTNNTNVGGSASILNTSSLTMSGDNVANNAGTGISNAGTALVTNAVLSGNQIGAISNGSVMTVSNSTIAGNSGSQGGGIMIGEYHGGAGVFNQGTLTVSTCTVSSNTTTQYGGGILNNGGSLTVSNSTFFGNSALDGGAIFYYSSHGSAAVSNSTFSGNTASASGSAGGIHAVAGSMILLNSIFTGNTPTNLVGSVDPASVRNLVVANAGLGPLANNGGPTQTMALLAGSPAIGGGGAVGTLAVAINATSTSISVAGADAIARTPGQYLIKIDSEVMLVTSASGNSLTVVRGYNGTAATTHNGTVPVFLATDQRGFLVTGARDIGAFQTKSGTMAAAFTSASSASFSPLTPGSFTVAAKGYPMPLLSESSTDILPAGVTFNPVTGLLSGTPAAGSSGRYTLHFTAHNGVGSDATQTFTLAVNAPPAITSADNTSFNAGTANSFTVTTTGFPTPMLSMNSSDVLPSGVAFNGTTGLLSGTPIPGSGGSYVLHFTAHNGVGSDALQTFTLTVVNVPLAPAFTSAGSTAFTAGTGSTFTVTASGWPTPTLSESDTDVLPGGITFNASSGVLSGTPVPGSGGSYVLHFTAQNGVGSDASQTFTLSVNEASEITSASSTTFTTGTPGSFTVTALGYPVPVLSKSPSDILPSGITFNAASGVLSGTPAPGTGRTYTLHFMAHNGVGNDASQTLTLTVNQAPAFVNPDHTTFVTARAGSFSIVASGFPNPTLSEDPGDTLPAGITFNAVAGVLGGTPAAGTAGTYTLHFAAHNGVGSDAFQAFTLTVSAAPQAPSFTSAKLTTFVAGIPGTFTVTANGSPAPNLSESSTDKLPSGVTFSAPSGTLSGTAAAGTGGVYTLHFTAGNGVGTTASQTFTLTVNEAPAFTSAAAATFKVGTFGTFAGKVRGFPMPTLGFDVRDTLPKGVSFNAATGVLSGTPAAGMGGTYVLHVTAHNGVGSDAVQTFTLTVNQPASFTSASSAAFAVGVPAIFAVTAGGFPFPSLTESPTDVLPSGIGITFNSHGQLSGTPAPGTNGTYTLHFTAHNGIGPDAAQTFKLTVAVSPSITASPANQSVNIGQVVKFTAAASGSPNPAVQWQVSVDGGASFANIQGAVATTISLTATAVRDGQQFRAVFSNVGGVAITTPAQLTVIPPPKPVIIKSPVNQVVAAGQPAIFTAAANSSPAPSIQWQVSTDNGLTFANITGATSNTLTIPATPLTDSGMRFRAVFNNGIGQAISSVAILTVYVPPTVTRQPVSMAMTAGQIVTFTATANGTPAPTIQWQMSNDGGVTFTNMTGFTSPTLSFIVAPVHNGYLFRAVFTNAVGKVTTDAAMLLIW